MDLITISDSLIRSDSLTKFNNINSLSSVGTENPRSSHSLHSLTEQDAKQSAKQTGGGMDDDVPKANIFVDQFVEDKLKSIIVRTNQMIGGFMQNGGKRQLSDKGTSVYETITSASSGITSVNNKKQTIGQSINDLSSNLTMHLTVNTESLLSELEQLGGAEKKKPVVVVIDKQKKYHVKRDRSKRQTAGSIGSISSIDSVKNALISTDSSMFTLTK